MYYCITHETLAVNKILLSIEHLLLNDDDE